MTIESTIDNEKLLQMYHMLPQVALPIKLLATPAQMRAPPPSLGEHTEAVLTELGNGKSQFEIFRKEAVV